MLDLSYMSSLGVFESCAEMLGEDKESIAAYIFQDGTVITLINT